MGKVVKNRCMGPCIHRPVSVHDDKTTGLQNKMVEYRPQQELVDTVTITLKPPCGVSVVSDQCTVYL